MSKTTNALTDMKRALWNAESNDYVPPAILAKLHEAGMIGFDAERGTEPSSPLDMPGATMLTTYGEEVLVKCLAKVSMSPDYDR